MYCTKEQLILFINQQEISQLTDYENGQVIDDAVLNQFISQCSNEIDVFLCEQYDLPFSTIPPLLTRICCDLVIYRLYKENVTELMQKKHEEDFNFLDSLSKGAVRLFDELNNVPYPVKSNKNTIGFPIMKSTPSIFGR